MASTDSSAAARWWRPQSSSPRRIASTTTAPARSIQPATMASITGRTTLSDSSQGQEIAWSNYFVFVDGSGNPLFDPNTLEWDVVVAQLGSPSPSSNSTPIKIAGADEASFWAPDNENAWATGWGTISSGGSQKRHVARGQHRPDRRFNLRLGNLIRLRFPSRDDGLRGGDRGRPGHLPGRQRRATRDPDRRRGIPSDRRYELWHWLCKPNLPGVYGRVAEDPMCSALQRASRSRRRERGRGRGCSAHD